MLKIISGIVGAIGDFCYWLKYHKYGPYGKWGWKRTWGGRGGPGYDDFYELYSDGKKWVKTGKVHKRTWDIEEETP